MGGKNAGIGAVNHDGDSVVGAHTVHQDFQGLFYQTQPVFLGHRARNIDDKGEGGRRPYLL
ncbi:MAG: hypothetical protein H6656_11775 [Ardenticatenaceae bacterium]|nr:hypothetical protein [Ardenticatenaceae bacterium]